MLAKAFAKALVCEAGYGDSCNMCRACHQFDSGNHPDVKWITHEKANSIGVDEVREQINNDIVIKPYSSKYKVYIIDEAEKMTVQAQNALLKTIEEPPEYAVILFLTNTLDVLLQTVRSRCIIMNLRSVDTKLIQQYLMQKYQLPDYQARVCAAYAQGNVGKAIMMATSEHFREMQDFLLRLLKRVDDMEVYEIVAAIHDMTAYKMDIRDLIDLMMVWYRDVLILKATEDINQLVYQDEHKYLQKKATTSSYEGLNNIMEALEKAKVRLNANVNFDITMEMLLLTMVKVIGVRFRNAGKIYYFDPLDLDIEVGQNVIVETARGIEYGHVLIAPREVDDSKVIQPLKAVIRLATPEDDEIERRNKEKEKDAFKICLEKIAKHKLQMKLIDAEYTFDNNKVLFYFTADGRIDFRELVKDLASVFKTRIELRQIGVRDETKIMGGIGICGRSLCCHTFLSEFAPVSIKMAKEQNLSLNPTKISGVCGRLMCCLKNEEETYEWLNSKLPNIGDRVTTDDGFKGEVQSVSVLRQLVKVIVTLENDEKEIREYKVSQLKFRPKRRRDKGNVNDAELKALEAMDRKEGKSSL